MPTPTDQFVIARTDIAPSAADAFVDARGLSCPQPILLLRAAMHERPEQSHFTLLATDPMAEIDVDVFCQRTGHVLVSRATQVDDLSNEEVIWFEVKRGA